MRSLEAMLVFANLLTFLVLAVPLPCALRRMRHAVPVVLAVAAAQVLIEGPRWEVAPAYMLTGLFCLVWLPGNVAPVGRRAGQLLANRLVMGLGLGLGVLGLAVSIASPLILPVFRFPTPGGPYGIGTMTYHWVDAGRTELTGTDPAAPRELMVQIWYPAAVDPASPRAPYMVDADAVLGAFADILGMLEVIFGHFKYATTNAVSSTPVAGDLASYLVLIYLEGAAGFRQMSTYQVEELVSRGYIIAALDQPGTAANVVFPDGRQLTALPIVDLRAVIGSSYLQRGQHAAPEWRAIGGEQHPPLSRARRQLRARSTRRSQHDRPKRHPDRTFGPAANRRLRHVSGRHRGWRGLPQRPAAHGMPDD